MDYDKAVGKLGRFTDVLRRVPVEIKARVTDIRLNTGKPIILNCCGWNYCVLSDGSVSLAVNVRCVIPTQADMDAVFHRLCGYSVYSHLDEIRSGFVSVDRSMRVGISGTAVVESGSLRTVRSITGLSIRIPREIPGCAREIFTASVRPEQGILIAGAPSSGKTTILRDIARMLGDSGHRTVVLDERFELLADGFDLGLCTDVLQGYPKKEGFSHAIRCLSPEFILCDELSEIDLPAVKAAAFAGVSLIATVHAGGLSELCQRRLCRELLESGIFGCVVLLEGRTERQTRILRAGDLLENCNDLAADRLRTCRRAV